MTGYVAKFSQGRRKSIANSKREYAAAWLFTVSARMVRDGKGGMMEAAPLTCMGFARDHGMAEAAIRREASHYLKAKGAVIVEREVVTAERL